MYNLLSTVVSKNIALRSFLYNFLLSNHRKSNSKLWKKSWKQAILKNNNKPVNTRLHGYKAVVNSGFAYPLITRSHPHFNNPLVELVHQVHKVKGVPVTLIDIGAAVGDTVFLLESNLKGAFNKIVCIDGDDEFFDYLEQNMKQFDFVKTVHVMLSDKEQDEKSLVRIHAGTASAQGEKLVMAKTLDRVVQENNLDAVDILKIDTDGFDGKVLRGASNFLKTQQPSVIFEWHPILIKKTGNTIEEAFQVLTDCGYSNFVFFTKFGNFNHYMSGVNSTELEMLAQVCLNNKFVSDCHYDVVATGGPIDIIALAECSFAKQKTSAY